MPIDKAVTLALPVEPASLTQDNIGTAIEGLLGLAEFESASFLITATDVFGSSVSFSPHDDELSPRDGLLIVSGLAGLAHISVVAQRTSERGDKVGVAGLTLEFVNCQATATVKPQSGLDRDAAQLLARRMVAQFPYRDFAGGTRDVEAEKLRAEVAGIRDQAQASLTEVQAAHEDAKQLVESLRATLAERTIKHQAGVFKNEGRGHFGLAGFWLGIAVVAAVFLFRVAITFESADIVSQQQPSEDASSDRQAAALERAQERALIIHILERVTLLSILATILGVSVRLHRTSLHNWVVATHRSNALQAYEAFAGATKDKPGADELLGQALALVFAPKDTGYSKASGAPDASQLFTEIVKRVPGPKGP